MEITGGDSMNNTQDTNMHSMNIMKNSTYNSKRSYGCVINEPCEINTNKRSYDVIILSLIFVIIVFYLFNCN